MSPDLLLTRDLILRPLTASDESAFSDLKALSGQETSRVRKDFQRLLGSTRTQTWLLERKSGQQLVGYLDWSQPNAPFVEISPGCRLHGYASQALDRISRFRDDLHELCFQIDTGDIAAQALLEKCGYHRVPESPGSRARYRIIMGQQRQITLELLEGEGYPATNYTPTLTREHETLTIQTMKEWMMICSKKLNGTSRRPRSWPPSATRR
ncbi:MAG: GNAT family N-acetyltransferase [Acidobacteria bacterium]|nr:GNAT family N-acetyltransferase [Acidobacteriota bacterium]